MTVPDELFVDRQARHDFMGLLNTLRLCAEYLVRGPPSPADALETLDDMISAAERAVEMLERGDL